MPVDNAALDILFTEALKARDQAYCPYSKFRVGACLVTEDGQLVTGGNVETAAYSGICAERSAIVKAVSMGYRKYSAIAVSSDIDGPCSPCGVCRQFLREFCAQEMPVYLVSSSWSEGDGLAKRVVKTSMAELLPMSFGPEELQKV